MLYLALHVCGLLGAITGRSILDLTHTFDEYAPQWPLEGLGVFNLTYYNLETLYAQSDTAGTWIALKHLEFYEHLGTHMDAPAHFGKGRQAMDEIPPDRLMGPGIMIDVKGKAKVNPNYGLSVDDIYEYEEKYGRIPPNAIVMMNSGWAEKYHNPNQVFGTDDLKNSSTFNFPGYTIEACQMLLQDRQVSVIGIDTPSIDIANAPTYACHIYLQPNNVPLLEYVANLDAMPPSGSTVFLGAMKHRGGTGGPVRIFAVVGDDDDSNTSGAALLSVEVIVILAMSMLLRTL